MSPSFDDIDDDNGVTCVHMCWSQVLVFSFHHQPHLKKEVLTQHVNSIFSFSLSSKMEKKNSEKLNIEIQPENYNLGG